MENNTTPFRAGTSQAIAGTAASQQNNGGYAAGTAMLEGISKGGTIGAEQVREAKTILDKYKEGKQNLDDRIVQNEKWYRARHWDNLQKKNSHDVEPTSAWLFNAIANKHADAMDNIPMPNILPREEGDEPEAKMLSSIVPIVMDQADFEAVYDAVTDYKLKAGTGVYGIFWDPYKLNGLGDIAIKKMDIISLFWEPGVSDIQDSRNMFSVELVDKEVLQEQYPELGDKLQASSFEMSKYEHDDQIDTKDKIAVIDWYYKRWVAEAGRTVLHYCKFVGDTVLFASENVPEYAERGWYDHGLYPFCFDPMYREEGMACGFGLIDVGKSAQEYIDRSNQAVIMNLLANARPRHFIRTDGSVNEEEYADYTKDFVHVDGNLGQDSVMPIQGKPLNGIYLSVLDRKVDELKETTGNRDVSNGGSTSGVTAASAIAAMQEAGSKLSRDQIKASYRVYKKIVLMVIELIRQFYTLPRCFRIMGEQNTAEYVAFSNEGMIAQQQEGLDGEEGSMRKPLFDVEVVPQKQSPYSKLSQNELALQFYSAGFFNPEMAQQALACLDMMDFDRKTELMRKIQQNYETYQQQQMMAMMMGAGMAPAPMGQAPVQGAAERQESLGGEGAEGESSITKNARQRVANSTSPT